MHQNKPMYITNVEKEGPFLKIWGQIDKKASLEVEEALHQASALFEEGKHKLKLSSLEVGVLCCAKYLDDKYYRARITSIALLSEGIVEVNFLDYGNKDTVSIINLRSPECFNSSFISLPPLSSPFILAEVVCMGGEWNDRVIEQIGSEIRYMEAHYVIVAQAIRFYFIKVFIHNTDVGVHLVQQNLMQNISIQTQEAVLLAMIPRTSQPVMPPNQSLLQYKSFTLEPNSRHEVYVSYVTDGPCHFSVQLKKYESALAQLMKEINSITLKPLDELPIPGTVCLAKCVEDNHICRAVVTSEVDSLYKLFYVDFGNTELVPPENLYQMAFKYIIPKIMAIRLSLDGVEKSTMTFEMQCAFKKFVDNRVLMMEVLPAPKKMALPKCRMWDPDTNIDVIEVLNRAAKCGYPDPIALHKGFTQLVKVSFVYSCNRFFVQLISKEPELNKLMIDLQNYCNSNQTSFLDKVKVGQPCCALFSSDEQWYRSQIVEVKGDKAKVQYIDYGNEEDVPIETLKVIEGEYLTVLRPQAIECCLNGYQNMGEDQNLDNQLEELILEQEFTMRVIDTIKNKTLIDLTNATGATVSALLLETFMTQSKKQTTPIVEKRFDFGKGPNLVDDEQISKPYYQHDNRRPPRSHILKDKNDENPSWRQNSRKRSVSNSNESTESWRQENKGFRGRRENDWNERSPNDSNKKEKGFRDRRENFNDTERRQRPRFVCRDLNGEWDSKQNEKREWSKNKSDRNQNEDWGSKDDNTAPRKPRNLNGDWGSKDENRGPKKPRSNNEEWGSKENNWTQNKPPRQKNDEWGSKDSRAQSRPPRFQKDEGSWGHDKPSKRRDNEHFDWGGNESGGSYRNRSTPANNDWNSKNSEGGGDRGDRRRYKDKSIDGDDWSANKGNSETRSEDRSRGDDQDFKKKSYKREGNDAASSGSEKSFGKGFRTSTRNDTRRPRSDTKMGNKNNNSWNVSQVPSVIDSAPNDATFEKIEVTGRREKVTISWFHNPCSFFCQLVESQDSFKTLMQDIQEAYKNRPPGSCVVGAPAIGLFPEDNVLYRAMIMDVIGGQYKIYYVDFGNVSVVDKVWPIEKKFMNMPMQAILCGMGGIESIDGSWPNPDNFSKYFEKECIDCTFLTADDEKYLVTLECNNENLAEQLVKDGLAQYSDSKVGDYDIGIIVGQQFHGMVKNANSLSEFNLLLHSGINLKCCAHNLEGATERNEELLKAQQDQILIAYADNLIDDKLEVTLYDLAGNKLNLINPDEGAFDTVEPLCPYLVTSPTILGFVSHVNETSIVIQPSDTSENLENILEQMYEYYENMPPLENPIIPEEESIYAVKSNDGNWYRGRVTTFDDEKATVVYLDYGNSEEVPFSRLRELEATYLTWATVALMVNVSVPTADFQDQDVKALIYCGEIGWEGEVQILQDFESVEEAPSEIKQSTEPFVQSIEVCAESSQDISEISAIQSSDTTEIAAYEESASCGVENEKVDPCRTSVILSHIDSPSDFYIQLVDSLTAINDLQLKLQDKIEEMSSLDSASVGGLCAAPYSIDQQWYRSQILDADDDITTVRFIDYGNTDVIDNKTTQIKTLPPDLLSLEEYATRCRLKIKPNEDEWSKAATDRFENLTAVDNIKVEFIDQDEKTNYVELYSNGINVKNIMIEENLALVDDVILEGKLTGFVSHMNSPSEFWVQLESCCGELEWIAEQLSNASTFPDLEDLTPGALCAAMFPDDEMWYRARILSNTVAGIEVLFIDYGNSCICINLKQLPEHLVMAQPLAQKCSLQKPEGLLNWSPEASQKFIELSADGETIFTVKKLTTGETSIVELLVHGEDISSKLLPNTDHGYVTDIDSLESFSVAKEGASPEERYKLEKIPGAEYNPDSVTKFVEIADEGKTCFDVEYLPENTVRLYLNGHDIRNQLKEILFNVVQVQESETMSIETKISRVDDISLSKGDDFLLTESPCSQEVDKISTSKVACDEFLSTNTQDCHVEDEISTSKRDDYLSKESQDSQEEDEISTNKGDGSLSTESKNSQFCTSERIVGNDENKLTNIINLENKDDKLKNSMLETCDDIYRFEEKTEINAPSSLDCQSSEKEDKTAVYSSGIELETNKSTQDQNTSRIASKPICEHICEENYIICDNISEIIGGVLDKPDDKKLIIEKYELSKQSQQCNEISEQNLTTKNIETPINKNESKQVSEKTDSVKSEILEINPGDVLDKYENKEFMRECTDNTELVSQDTVYNDASEPNSSTFEKAEDDTKTKNEVEHMSADTIAICVKNELNVSDLREKCVGDEDKDEKSISKNTDSINLHTKYQPPNETPEEEISVTPERVKDDKAIEFREKIVESFPAPTVSENVIKLTSTKVSPKSKDVI